MKTPLDILSLLAAFALAVYDTLFLGKSIERQMEELGS